MSALTVKGSCFLLDSNRGLVPLPNTTRLLNLPQSATIPNGPDTTVSNIVFTDDDRKLVVAVKGSRDNPDFIPAFIAIWDINEDMSLSVGFAPIDGGVWIWSLMQVPGRNAFVGGDGIAGVDIYDLDTPVIQSNPSTRVRQLRVPGQGGICWVTYSKVTKNFYLVDLVHPSIDEIHVDADLNGTVVAVRFNHICTSAINDFTLQSHPLDRFDGPSDISIAHVNGKE